MAQQWPTDRTPSATSPVHAMAPDCHPPPSGGAAASRGPNSTRTSAGPPSPSPPCATETGHPPPIHLHFFPSTSTTSRRHPPLASLPSCVGRRPPKPRHLPTDPQEQFVHLPPSERHPSPEFRAEASLPPAILGEHRHTLLHSPIWTSPHLPFPHIVLQEPTDAPSLTIIGCTSLSPSEPPHR
jgi:hypothetical protein